VIPRKISFSLFSSIKKILKKIIVALIFHYQKKKKFQCFQKFKTNFKKMKNISKKYLSLKILKIKISREARNFFFDLQHVIRLRGVKKLSDKVIRQKWNFFEKNEKKIQTKLSELSEHPPQLSD